MDEEDPGLYVDGKRIIRVEVHPSTDCGCPFNYPHTCPMCGHTRITNHCPHDGVQNPCPACRWIEPGKRTPLQFLGWKPTPPKS